jgi:hypothetical protein
MRDNGWKSLLVEVLLFCDKHNIPIFNMDEIFVVGGRLRRQTPQITNLHHFLHSHRYATSRAQQPFFRGEYRVATLYGLLES